MISKVVDPLGPLMRGSGRRCKRSVSRLSVVGVRDPLRDGRGEEWPRPRKTRAKPKQTDLRFETSGVQKEMSDK